MKAIRVHQFGGPEVMKLETEPDPKPAAGQVLVRLRAIGVNPVDTYVRSGGYTVNITFPFIPGSDGAGVIEAVGDGVKRFHRGDRVYIFGTTSGIRTGAYAELAVCVESRVCPLPANVSFTQGAAVGVPYSTAYRALFQKARAVPGGDRVHPRRQRRRWNRCHTTRRRAGTPRCRGRPGPSVDANS